MGVEKNAGEGRSRRAALVEIERAAIIPDRTIGGLKDGLSLKQAVHWPADLASGSLYGQPRSDMAIPVSADAIGDREETAARYADEGIFLTVADTLARGGTNGNSSHGTRVKEGSADCQLN